MDFDLFYKIKMIYSKPISPSILSTFYFSSTSIYSLSLSLSLPFVSEFFKWGILFSVICSPYYLPQSDRGFYPQYHNPKVLLPGGIRRRPKTEKREKSRAFDDAGYNTALQEYDTLLPINSQETLPLFPLHPTGILQGETGKSSIGSSANNSTKNPSFSEVEEGSGDQLFFDFFSREGSCESHG